MNEKTKKFKQFLTKVKEGEKEQPWASQ